MSLVVTHSDHAEQLKLRQEMSFVQKDASYLLHELNPTGTFTSYMTQQGIIPSNILFMTPLTLPADAWTLSQLDAYASKL